MIATSCGDAVVVVGRDVAGVAVEHLAGRAGEGVPDGRAATVLVERPLDLVRGGGRAPEEVGGELASGGARGRHGVSFGRAEVDGDRGSATMREPDGRVGEDRIDTIHGSVPTEQPRHPSAASLAARSRLRASRRTHRSSGERCACARSRVRRSVADRHRHDVWPASAATVGPPATATDHGASVPRASTRTADPSRVTTKLASPTRVTERCPSASSTRRSVTPSAQA